MTQQNKLFGLLGLCIFTLTFAQAIRAQAMPTLDAVMQKGFPAQQDELAKTTARLFDEYKKTNNVSALVFYSYGMLSQANHFSEVNDFINASEYSKTGFFYLDEAVDSHEFDPRVRYLRARIDAWLPASIGRCAVTLGDTEELLKNAAGFGAEVRNHIIYMRYRAFYSCRKYKQASELLAQLKQRGEKYPGDREPGFERAPAWDMNEVTQVLLPLVRGE